MRSSQGGHAEEKTCVEKWSRRKSRRCWPDEDNGDNKFPIGTDEILGQMRYWDTNKGVGEKLRAPDPHTLHRGQKTLALLCPSVSESPTGTTG